MQCAKPVGPWYTTGGRIMPIFRLFAAAALNLVLVTTAARAQPMPASLPEPILCPAFEQCTDKGCAEIPVDVDLTLHHVQVQGIQVPMVRTNYPLVNAGLYFFQRYHSDLFLNEAIKLVCRGSLRGSSIRCDLPIAVGQPPGTSPDFDVYDVWAPVGLPPAAPGASASTHQLEACQEYARLERAVSDALLPSIALQSNAYSEEGIRLRVNLGKLLAARHALELGCTNMAALAAPPTATGKPCLDMRQYLDDAKFALMLIDKFAADNKSSRSWSLAASCDRSMAILSEAAQLASTPGKEAEFRRAMGQMLGVQWADLRNAIQDALVGGLVSAL